MTELSGEEANLAVAQRWCDARGAGWAVLDTAGRGGTAPVFTVQSPSGLLALKLYDPKFSEGKLGEESERRLTPQLELGLHDCPYLVRIHDGGRFEDRLYLLMDKAPGQELEKRLKDIPRASIRTIIDQVTVACIFLRQRGLSHRDIKSANIFISDDFSHVTVLDLSVLRDIYDPVGLGTDHGDTLPVVATSRYSPPEYLFRLLPASEELWHALDVYQIGGVLHDLIMREPMFEQDYLLTRDTNRYRFAWIVATQDPVVQAVDVDADLVFLAKRALDKDWRRRSSLRLDDFRDDAVVRGAHGLMALGVNVRGPLPSSNRGAVRRWMGELSNEVEGAIVAGLRSSGVTAHHRTEEGASEAERALTFSWDPSIGGADATLADASLTISLVRQEGSSGIRVAVVIALAAKRDGQQKIAQVALPEVVGNADAASAIAGSALTALGDLAIRIMEA
jgi:hypothetical protein